MQADSGNFVVRRVALASGSVVTLAGSPTSSGTADGTGTVARFSFPSAIAMDAAGTTALVADTFGHTLRRVAVATGVVSTLAGTPATAGHANGLGAAATFYLPGGVAMTSAGDVALVVRCSIEWVRCVYGVGVGVALELSRLMRLYVPPRPPPPPKILK